MSNKQFFAQLAVFALLGANVAAYYFFWPSSGKTASEEKAAAREKQAPEEKVRQSGQPRAVSEAPPGFPEIEPSVVATDSDPVDLLRDKIAQQLADLPAAPVSQPALVAQVKEITPAPILAPSSGFEQSLPLPVPISKSSAASFEQSLPLLPEKNADNNRAMQPLPAPIPLQAGEITVAQHALPLPPPVGGQNEARVDFWPKQVKPFPGESIGDSREAPIAPDMPRATADGVTLPLPNVARKEDLQRSQNGEPNRLPPLVALPLKEGDLQTMDIMPGRNNRLQMSGGDVIPAVFPGPGDTNQNQTAPIPERLPTRNDVAPAVVPGNPNAKTPSPWTLQMDEIGGQTRLLIELRKSPGERPISWFRVWCDRVDMKSAPNALQAVGKVMVEGFGAGQMKATCQRLTLPYNETKLVLEDNVRISHDTSASGAQTPVPADVALRSDRIIWDLSVRVALPSPARAADFEQTPAFRKDN